MDRFHGKVHDKVSKLIAERNYQFIFRLWNGEAMNEKLFLIGFLPSLIFGFRWGDSYSKFSYMVSPTVTHAQTLQIYGTGENPDRPELLVASNKRSSFVEEVERYVCSDKFKWDCATAKRIIACESGWDIKARNSQGSTATGLWQFTASTYTWVRRDKMGKSSDLQGRLDPFESTDTAYALYQIYGFNSTASWARSHWCWREMK